MRSVPAVTGRPAMKVLTKADVESRLGGFDDDDVRYTA
jgi:hypothetical protein